MNCHPGCLARVINDPAARSIGLVDRILKVTVTSGKADDGWPCWEYEGPPIQVPLLGAVLAISDAILRPIGNPGDDAVDEVLQRLGKPVTNEPVTA